MEYRTLKQIKLEVTAAQLESQIAKRISNDLEFFNGEMPREVAVSWSGYLQAVGEWAPEANGSIIGRLRRMLPEIKDDPSGASSSGRI